MSVLRRLVRRFNARERRSDITAATASGNTIKDKAVGGRESLAEEQQRLIAEVAAYTTAGRFCDALVAVDSALTTTCDDPALLYARASTLLAWGRSREALECFF